MIKRFIAFIAIACFIVMGICHMNDNYDVKSIMSKSFAAHQMVEYHSKSVEIIELYASN